MTILNELGEITQGDPKKAMDKDFISLLKVRGKKPGKSLSLPGQVQAGIEKC